MIQKIICINSLVLNLRHSWRFVQYKIITVYTKIFFNNLNPIYNEFFFFRVQQRDSSIYCQTSGSDQNLSQNHFFIKKLIRNHLDKMRKDTSNHVINFFFFWEWEPIREKWQKEVTQVLVFKQHKINNPHPFLRQGKPTKKKSGSIHCNFILEQLSFDLNLLILWHTLSHQVKIG